MAARHVCTPILGLRMSASPSKAICGCEQSLLCLSRSSSRITHHSTDTTLCDSPIQIPDTPLSTALSFEAYPRSAGPRYTHSSSRPLSIVTKCASLSSSNPDCIPRCKTPSPSVTYSPMSSLRASTKSLPQRAERRLSAVCPCQVPRRAPERNELIQLTADAPRNVYGSLGLMFGTSTHPPVPPPAATSYSRRLRSLAPPPLQLIPSYFPLASCNAPAHTPLPMSPLDDLVDVSLASPPNISPRSHPPAPSARSTASFIDVPTDEDDASTSLSSFDILRWQRRIPCDFGSPMVPPLSGVQLSALPRIPASSAPLRADNSALPSPQYVPCDEPPAYPGTAETPVSALANPPPLRRSMVPLPPVPYEEQAGMQSDELLSPLMTNLRDVFRIESLVARAEKSADASRDAALSLCSCSLLKDPKAIMEVCNCIPPLLATIQVELNKMPKAFGLKNSGDLQRWFHRHCEILASVERNIDLFYLFANKIRQNPPRIHKLEGYVNKFYAYHVKFSDLARRLAISNEKLHLIDLRARLIAENRAARLHADQERMHRHDFRVTWQEDRERRRAMREEFLLARDTARQLKLAKMSSNDIVPAAATEARRQG